MKLYKFFPNERVDFVHHLQVRLTPPTAFNDPFDMLPVVESVSGTKRATNAAKPRPGTLGSVLSDIHALGERMADSLFNRRGLLQELPIQESYLSKNAVDGIEISGRITNCRAAAYLNPEMKPTGRTAALRPFLTAAPTILSRGMNPRFDAISQKKTYFHVFAIANTWNKFSGVLGCTLLARRKALLRASGVIFTVRAKTITRSGTAHNEPLFPGGQ